ncbi:hypothetical protein Tco_0729499 [Tanacetum coccineum]|uniref:Uncharacterized protein n=1 Tax=Tanacetum coccineum TaxID=301880 RepID=A0ABQ4YP59_9ASTR
MAALKYKDDHNKIAYLGRERGCEDFTDILSYLDHSPLRYALTHDPPVVFDSLVKQFWATAVVRPNAAGSHDLVATIDGREVVVTESLIRTQLQFDDANGIFDMPINDILEGMRVIGYPTDGTLTFLKIHLSPQWRFLVHTIMHCLSPKSGSWNQFPSSIATALICLSTGRLSTLVPQLSSVFPVREPTPEQQPVSQRPSSPSPTIPETNGCPYPVSTCVAGPDLDHWVRAEDPALLTIYPNLQGVWTLLTSLETELEVDRMNGGAILTLVSKVKKLEKMVKELRDTRLVVDASAAEEDVDDEKRKEVPLRRKRSAYRRARTEFSTLAFEQFQATLSAGVLPHTAVTEPAGPSVALYSGKRLLCLFDIPAEFLAENAQSSNA